jgi:hypothetical protein
MKGKKPPIEFQAHIMVKKIVGSSLAAVWSWGSMPIRMRKNLIRDEESSWRSKLKPADAAVCRWLHFIVPLDTSSSNAL